MTTPATFNTAEQIITFALKDAGYLGDGDSPSGEQLADGINRLNQIITFEQTQGLKIWLQEEVPVTLTAGKNNYPMQTGGSVNTPKPMRVLSGWYVYTTGGARLPLNPILSHDDWLNLPNVSTGTSNQGQISQFFPNKLQSSIELNFWLTPDSTCASNGTVVVLAQGPVTTFVGLTDSMNFPTEWGIWLHWALAAEIATGQPQRVIDRCEQKSALYRTALENWDVEDAPTQFVPDMSRAAPFMNRFA